MRDSVFSHFVNIQSDKESSAPLITLFGDLYDPTTRRFVLNNNTSFSFCAKEVADVLGLENTGLSISTPAAKRVPQFVYDLMKECDPGSSRKISTATIKKLLSQMDVNDEESKLNFKKLFCYFFIEIFFIPSPDPKKPRTSAWAMVEDLIKFEEVNWAESIYDDLHGSFNKLKNAIKTGSAKQHNFKGCAPVFEVVLFERIPSLKLKLKLSPFHYPPIQKYDANRVDWEVLKTIEAYEIIPCEYCVTAEEENESLKEHAAAETENESSDVPDETENKSLTEDVNESLTEDVGESEKNETLKEHVAAETENESLTKDVAAETENESLTEDVGESEKNESLTKDVADETEKNESFTSLVDGVVSLYMNDASTHPSSPVNAAQSSSASPPQSPVSTSST